MSQRGYYPERLSLDRRTPQGKSEKRLLFLFFVVFNLDAERFEEFQILIADFEVGIGAERGDKRGLVGSVFALFADADGGFENQENVIAAFLDAGHDFGDRFGIGQRLVDRFSEFFHELLQLLIHDSPWRRPPLTGDITGISDLTHRHCTPARC